MRDSPAVLAARAEVERRKVALIATAREIQIRLAPKTLASEAWEKAKEKGADLAEDAVDAVKRRPVATGGVIAALAMFLARDPIKDAARRVMKKRNAANGAAVEQDDKPAPPPARRRARRAAVAMEK